MQEFKSGWAVVGESGVDAMTWFPVKGSMEHTRAMLLEGDRVWLHAPGVMLYLTLPEISGPNAASGPYPMEEEEAAGPATFVRDGRDGEPLLFTSGGYRSTVWRLDTATGVRAYEGRFKQPFTTYTMSGVSTEDGVEVVQQGTAASDTANGLMLRQLRWDGTCARERSLFTMGLEGFGGQGFAGYGDLDGDGDEDVAWATGTEVLVLERNGGWLTLAARIPLEEVFGGPVIAEAHVGDLDGDGQAELWVTTNSVWPSSTPANVVFRRAP